MDQELPTTEHAHGDAASENRQIAVDFRYPEPFELAGVNLVALTRVEDSVQMDLCRINFRDVQRLTASQKGGEVPATVVFSAHLGGDAFERLYRDVQTIYDSLQEFRKNKPNDSANASGNA